MRKPIIAGNWKLNNTLQQAIELVTLLKRGLSDVTDVDVVVCPVATALTDVKDVLNESNIGLGAQNVYWEDAGAFTGEISAPLLKDIGVQYVIIGHSERRSYYREGDELLNRKTKLALSKGLKPIFCCGEVLEEREEGKLFDVIREQVSVGLAGLSKEDMSKVLSLMNLYGPLVQELLLRPIRHRRCTNSSGIS